MTHQSVKVPVYDKNGAEWLVSAFVTWYGDEREVELFVATRDGLEMIFEDWADICAVDSAKATSKAQDDAVEAAMQANAVKRDV